MLVSTPVPETDDRCSEEYYIARELRIHGVARIGVEHMGGAVTFVGGITYGHHVLPTGRDAASAESREAEEEYEERTNNKNRCLDG